MILTLLVACGPAEDAKLPKDPLDSSWVGTLSREPARFEGLVAAARAGRVACHKNGWGCACVTLRWR